MADFFEMLMVVSFGISWPISIVKAIKSRTAEGKSILFSCFIWGGYVFGVISKLLQSSLTYVFVFYIINLVSVSVDIGLYFRNRRYDRKKDCLELEGYYEL